MNLEPAVAPLTHAAEPQTADFPAPPHEEVEAAGFASLLSLPTSPRDKQEAWAWAAGQSHTRDKDWTGRCQEFCHTCYGIGGGFPSALAQFHGLPEEDRIVGGDPDAVPEGWVLFSQSRIPSSLSFRFGHVILKARPFADGLTGAWSTDAVRTGWPDKINPQRLYAQWDHAFLGAGRNMNGVDFSGVAGVAAPKPPPAPKQDKAYLALEAAAKRTQGAINATKVSLATAQKQHDSKDVARLKETISQLQASEARLKRQAAHLRHA